MTSLLKLRVVISHLTSCVSCLSPWAGQNFPGPLKIDQTLPQSKKTNDHGDIIDAHCDDNADNGGYIVK